MHSPGHAKFCFHRANGAWFGYLVFVGMVVRVGLCLNWQSCFFRLVCEVPNWGRLSLFWRPSCPPGVLWSVLAISSLFHAMISPSNFSKELFCLRLRERKIPSLSLYMMIFVYRCSPDCYDFGLPHWQGWKVFVFFFFPCLWAYAI